jgi:hypothetical protein
MRTFRPLAAALCVAGLAATLVACDDTTGPTATTPASDSAADNTPAAAPVPPPADTTPAEDGAAPAGDPDGAVAAALATLDTLEVKGRAPKTGYDREQFGPAWKDVDRNGCDTRIIYSSQQGCLPTVLFRVHFSENSQGMSDRGTFATRSGMQA